MNDTSASVPGVSLLPDGIAAITTVHFALMALVALAALAIIIVGAARKRRRKAAAREVEARAADAGVVADAPEPEPEPAPEPAPRPEPDRGVEAPPPPPIPAPAPPPVEPAPLADEPIAAAAPLDASLASVAADVPAGTPGDDPAQGPVTQLKGLGPKLADRLAMLGITQVGQLAALTDDEAAVLDAQLGPFAGRMARDRWIEQSRFLAAGDRAGFEAVFGRL